MATDLDTFGAGIFDEPAKEEANTEVASAEESVQTDEPQVTLTDREIAIAKGEDPDAEPVQEEVEAEETQQEPEAVEQVDEVVEEEEPAVDAFSLGDRKLAARYGLSEEDLQKFGSPEALHHALDLFDKTGAKVGQSEDSAESPAENSAEDAAAEDKGGALSELLGFEKLDVSKYEKSEDPYDEDTLELVKHVRKTEDLLEKLTSAITATQTADNATTFHDMLDKYPDIYGSTMKDGEPVKIDSKFEAARQAVVDQAETIYAGIVARKGQVPPINKIIEQAMMAVHGKSLTADKPKAPTKKDNLKKQSSMRRSVGSAATNKKRQAADIDPSDARSIAKHPDLDALWRKAQEENGAV